MLAIFLSPKNFCNCFQSHLFNFILVRYTKALFMSFKLLNRMFVIRAGLQFLTQTSLILKFARNTNYFLNKSRCFSSNIYSFMVLKARKRNDFAY